MNIRRTSGILPMTRALAITRQGWRTRITDAWQQVTTATVEGTISIGKMLNEAKASLEHGQWIQLIGTGSKEGELPFTARTAQMFMRIANDERLAKTKHVSFLPPSWGTLYQLTRLPDEQFDKMMRRGEIHPEMQRNEITSIQRIELRKQDAKRVKRLQKIVGKFTTLVIDPPWDYEWLSIGGRSKPGYECMSLPELVELDVGQWASEQCHVYLWTTNNFMAEACNLMKLWGFQHKTVITWVKTDKKGKPRMGAGSYFRNTTEHVLFGMRGSDLRTRKSSTTPTHFEAPVGKHSEKPEAFYDIVRRQSYLPAGECFQRQARKQFINLFQDRDDMPQPVAMSEAAE